MYNKTNLKGDSIMANKIQHSTAFKQDAVNYYYSSVKTQKEAAKGLKIDHSTLSKWIAGAKTNEGVVAHRGSGNYASEADKEIARLKKDLRDHKDALDILKKAIIILND